METLRSRISELEKAAEMMAQTPMGNQSQQASEGNQTADDVVDADSKMKQ